MHCFICCCSLKRLVKVNCVTAAVDGVRLHNQPWSPKHDLIYRSKVGCAVGSQRLTAHTLLSGYLYWKNIDEYFVDCGAKDTNGK